jgi:hypothetical protein
MATNLGVQPAKFPVDGIHGIVAAQEAGRVTEPFCVLGGTAYARWLQTQYPLMRTLEVIGGEEAIVQAIETNECAGAINTYPLSLSTISRSRNLPLFIVGDPLLFGPQV